MSAFRSPQRRMRFLRRNPLSAEKQKKEIIGLHRGFEAIRGGISQRYAAPDSFAAACAVECQSGTDNGTIVRISLFFQPWYSLGVSPNCFLKLFEKWDKVEKPVMSAISEIV